MQTVYWTIPDEELDILRTLVGARLLKVETSYGGDYIGIREIALSGPDDRCILFLEDKEQEFLVTRVTQTGLIA